MTAATSRLRRRGIGAGVAALVGLTSVGFTAVAAQAAPNFDITRPAQTENRFATAASVATATFPTGAPNVVIANGDNAVDALGAAALAGVNTPILYVRSGDIPAETMAALRALNPTTAWIVGGTTAVSEAVVNALPASVTTKNRVSGADRYETAVNIAARAATVRGGAAPTTAFLARGDVFADALAIAPVAAKTGTPIFLTETATINPTTLAGLRAQGIRNVTILGGEAAVSTSVRDALAAQGITVTRIAGADRAETALNIANTAAFGFSKTGVALVNGFAPVDALPASVYAAKNNFPIILTEGAVLGNDAEAYFTANAATLTTGLAVGGTAVLPETVVTAAEEAGGAGDAVGSIAVTPNTAATATVVNDTGGANDATDDRTYTVTGLTAGTTYRITLVNAASIQVGANGQVSFLSSADAGSASGFSADVGADIANITSVNNARPTFADTDTAFITTTTQPVAGNITFTIDGTAPGTVVPVVYINGGTGGTATTGGTSIRLETSATAVGTFAAATETFGLGGPMTYVAPLATGGGLPASSVVAAVDKANNSFTITTGGVTSRYTYDTVGDTFTVDGASVGLTAFEAALSAGDGIAGTFAVDPEGGSVFNLTDSNPGLPTLTPTVNGGNDVSIAVNFGANAVDSLIVERAAVSGDVVGAFTAVAGAGTLTAAQIANGTATITDMDVAAGTYRYRITGVNDGDQGAPATTGNVVTTAPTADTTAPLTISDRLVTNAGFTSDADTNDVIRLIFNEDVTATGTAAIRFTDSAGDTYQLTNGTNATFALNAASVTIAEGSDAGTYTANRVLTITLTGNPTPIGATLATALPATYPLTVRAAAGIADTAGNAWNAGQTPVVAATPASALIQGVTATANAAGTAGNSLSIQFVQGSGNSVALSAARAGDVITVTLPTDSAGVAVAATQGQVEAAIDAATSTLGVTAASANAATAVAVAGPTAFTGGTNQSNADTVIAP
ncbi:putative cell wall-binding protein [Kineococcus xinjiangensis]|uniref:Putative cell wall-binding protein n=1 Tax=Kineococcus xinjiangensis TaxID=512762 RepID=A0A2S6IFW0_9ACTN|nr:cell wall-binding repeat-containing protein [Kineococcus xinjiangensis]PPK93098.1 putative cell wall-binding protein [Kineococcus xinjiangensis]